jgi:hypothetical protein
MGAWKVLSASNVLKGFNVFYEFKSCFNSAYLTRPLCVSMLPSIPCVNESEINGME